MELEKIFKLIDAGFSKDEILAMTSAKAPTSKEEASEAPDKVEAPEAPEAPAKPAAPQPLFPQLDDAIAQLTAAAKALQRSNVGASQQPEPQSTDEILASIINPSR